MRSSIFFSICIIFALLALGIKGIEDIPEAINNNQPNHIPEHTQENSNTDNTHNTNTHITDNKQDNTQIPAPQEEERTKKAEGLYLEGIQKRKYRYWVEYGPDDDWTERKLNEDVNEAIKLLEQAGDLGQDDGYHAIGEIYEYGELGHIDFIKAREYYEKAAKTGNPSAQAALSFIYGTGKNVTKNEALSQLYTLFAARAGDSMAQMTMGNKFFYGLGTPKSCLQAAEWYYLAAHQAVTDAEGGFGSIHEQIRLSTEAEATHPIQQDEDVVQYFQYAASAGDSQSYVNLGDLHLNGQFGVERDYMRAFEYYKQAAELQNAEGLSGMATMYAHGWGVEQNNNTALKIFKQAAELGSPSAQTHLGIYYYRGWNVPRSYKEALRLFNLASEQKHAAAMVQLGHMHFNGEGVTKDTKKAYEYYLAGYQAHHLSSTFFLGEMYLHGHGAQIPDCQTAVVLYKRVAERGLWAELLVDAHDLFEEGNYEASLLVYEHLAEMGYEVAQSNAAWMYDKGLGVTVREDGWPTAEYAESQAFRYYTRAAEQHNPAAHVVLGDYYYYGKGTEVDFEKAASCYETARRQPHVHASQVGAVAQALFNLGYMHEHGIGLKKDLFLAKRFYDEALAKNEDAYIAVWLALAKLGFHYIHDVITGEVDWVSFSSPSPSPSPTPTPSSTPTSAPLVSSFILAKLRTMQWDNILIVILSTILGLLIVVRQRRMLQQQQQR